MKMEKRILAECKNISQAVLRRVVGLLGKVEVEDYEVRE